ncbi:hypothetical protein LA6_001169 [Marinibacterium anthonyi]|nr:hypothetical protein LA6_001169 [Marinibacterium anthonyi]
MGEQYREELYSFFGHLDDYAFAQPLVADTIGASQLELNDMRRAELLTEGWHKNGRVHYTGRGLLLAGVMMELAWLMRPREAAAHAQAFTNWFDQCAKGLEENWDARICHIPQPVLEKNSENLPRLIEQGTREENPLGRRIIFSYEADYRQHPLPNHAVVVLPVGKLVRQWAIGAVLRLREAESDQPTGRTG